MLWQYTVCICSSGVVTSCVEGKTSGVVISFVDGKTSGVNECGQFICYDNMNVWKERWMVQQDIREADKSVEGQMYGIILEKIFRT